MHEHIDAGGDPRRPLPFLDVLDRIAEVAAMAAFLVMIFATLLQVFARYLHIPIDWTEELARTVFVAAMMIGIALAIRRREHIVVDFIFARLGRRAQAALSVAFDVAIIFLLVIWARGALRLMNLNAGTTFVTLPWLPVSAVYAVEAFAILLMILFVLADLVRQGEILRGRP